MKKEEVAELWIKIDKLHLQYLETVEDVAKLRIRSDLEDEVVKYLSIVPHDRRFVSLTTGDIITSTMMSHPNLSLPNIASSFRAVEQYASNLINDSGRTVPELWKIDQRSSFYIETIQNRLAGGAVKFFLEMGFTNTAPFISELPALNISAVTAVARDCLLAAVECSLMAEIETGVSEAGFPFFFLLEIDQFRRNNLGSVKQAIKEIVFRKRFGQWGYLDLGLMVKRDCDQR